MDYANPNRASVVRLLVPLLIAGVAAACTGAASSAGPSGAASAPSSAAGSSSAPSSAPSTASPTRSPASPPAATASPTGSPASPPASTASPTGSPTSDTVKLGVARSSSLGSYLTAPNGKTLYTLSSDPADKSTCTGECATAWPPLKIAPNGKVEAPVMGTFGIIKRADGTDQVALDGHPLYEFIKDTAPGQTNGEGIVAFGGTWHVAKAG
jgi:predicted lipoprotein with Yx(FWY)xxD motif